MRLLCLNRRRAIGHIASPIHLIAAMFDDDVDKSLWLRRMSDDPGLRPTGPGAAS
jgi:hypothetical protein